MAEKKTLKHEMTYDTETGQVIFNNRNKSAKSPVNKAFPERLVGELIEETPVEETSTEETEEEPK